ncbi:ExbD/TolR family protein [candidate division CSSED10-310 bacterium]|uniref:ExbD/TolR family protein n=1 Tax=candidate division CSSED10-310 bacterium TaxID=2855610 RepID=A0ABV6YR18_UNCC1
MNLKQKYTHSGNIPATTIADIAFLLIIFFMIATTFNKDKVNVVLPQSKVQVEIPKNAISISISEDNIFYWDGKETNQTMILELAKLEIEKNKGRYFIIKADSLVRFEVIDQIMQTMKKAGVQNLCLPTKPEKESEET